MTCLVHSVFWDLYCAAPERRETCDHSSEAKAFHDYVSNAYIGTIEHIALSSAKEDNNFPIKAKNWCAQGCAMSQIFYLLELSGQSVHNLCS